MRQKKIKIRVIMLRAFSSVLFFSFLLTGIIFNIAIRISLNDTHYLLGNYGVYVEPSRFIGRAGLTLFVLVIVMFIVSVIVTYFLSNSLTKPIEKLGEFALNIGKGDFTPNDFKFRELELESLNNALNKSAKQLKEYDAHQKTFFQNASHELRTPLMSIKCYAEGISFGIMDTKEACETILHETDKLSDLVTDLLYISKIDNISTIYRTAETDLGKLIINAAQRQEAVASKNDLQFSFDFSHSTVPYKCVDELISRALNNLISNALRYARTKIILSCHLGDECVKIYVEDDGAGISAEALPHIFERFYKGAGGNHGIGLSIVASIVNQHGGHITAENSGKGGAIFTVTLPL